MFSFHRRKSRPSVDTLPPSSMPPLPSPIHVLLVGQIYQDTILYMDDYPREDTKIRAKDMEQRRGGNICNTAEVLCQFPRMDPHVMSCLGTKEASSPLVSGLEEIGIKTRACVYRPTPLPSSYIIQSGQSGTRTIISCNKTIELNLEEFTHHFNTAPPYAWVHFEGRNIDNTVQQIDWLAAKAQQEGWSLTISVELEKPDRPDIDLLLPKGDVVFFSKLFAQTRNYHHPKDFLRSMQPLCKPGATLFCTWGEGGATCLLPSGEIHHASAIPVHQVIDSVGAGDTFIAGIIFCLTRQLHVLTALKFACEMASRKVEKVGFNGLAEMMRKLWEASLDLAAPSRK